MPAIVWKGHLTFGLVSIPVKLIRAARRERVRLHYVRRDERAEQPRDEGPAAFPEASVSSIPTLEQRSQSLAPLPHPAAPAPVPAPVSRVRQSLISSADEQPVSRADVLKAYEVEPDRYVVLEQDELRGLQRRTSPNMEIV